ncbi:MAG: LysM peptidoglycan-binding domain-containing protein [Phascolarctobacterium sp.]|nr:LysM peptidoglycan-binding domain-containing protein [Phascolarctobacterium sp.]
MKKALVLLGITLVLYTGYNMVFATEYVYKEHTITVTSGETLWDIAGRYAEKDEDVREVIHRISSANNLKSRVIYSGQVLKVPVRVEAQDAMLATK